MIMSQIRIRELNRKQSDATISDSESAELNAMLDALAKTMFDACPACRGAFSLAAAQENVCPNCETKLIFFSTDLVGHQPSEVDSSIEVNQILGVFSSGYALPGTIPCLSCGIAVPKNYECCPALFLTALDLIESGSETETEAGIRFLDSHIATLVNSLRGGFADLFTKQYLLQIETLASDLQCGDELRRIIDERGITNG